MIAEKIKHGWGYDCGAFPPAVVLGDGGRKIDFWPDGNAPTMEEIEAVAVPESVPVPEAITAVQGRLALLQAGLLDAVESSISGTSREVQIFWEFATEWHRSHAVLNSLGQSLGLSGSQVDDLFRLAKGL